MSDTVNKEKRDKIKALDLIRAISMLGIVLFHYSYNYIEYGISGNVLRFNKFPTGDWGGLFVAMFFMISGASLWYNYGEKCDTASFYAKRWLSIFPMFYLAWFFGYLAKVQELGSWLWGGRRRNFLYTVFGVDGYFLNPGVNINYYTLGEWFLGAIIMLYALYPLMRQVFLKRERTGIFIRCFSTILLAVLFTLNLYRDWFSISDGKNLLSCMMDFWIGMLLMDLFQTKKNLKNNRLIFLGVLIFVLIIMFVPLGIPEVMVSTLAGGGSVFLLFQAGEYPMSVKPVEAVIGKLSGWSYGIFLVHHVILYAFMKQYQGQTFSFGKSVVTFFVVFGIIVVTGAILTLAGKYIKLLIVKLWQLTGKGIRAFFP